MYLRIFHLLDVNNIVYTVKKPIVDCSNFLYTYYLSLILQFDMVIFHYGSFAFNNIHIHYILTLINPNKYGILRGEAFRTSLVIEEISSKSREMAREWFFVRDIVLQLHLL